VTLPRHLQRVGDVYKTRLIVPADLRPFVGKIEFVKSHGTDRNRALRNHPRTIAGFLDELDAARAKAVATHAKDAPPPRKIDHGEVAREHYQHELAIDEALRDRFEEPELPPHFRDVYEKRLWRVVEGMTEDDETAAVIGWAIAKLGTLAPKVGTQTWRTLAVDLARAQIEVMRRKRERDEGSPEGKPTAIILQLPEKRASKVKIDDLFADYMTEAKAAGKAKEAETRWKPVFASLKAYLRHDDAARVTPKDATGWKADLIKKGLAPKTIADVHLAAARAIFRWAKENHRIEANPFAEVRMKARKTVSTRDKGFTDEEAKAILQAAHAYKKSARESQHMADAKKWVPLICAYSGCRVTEAAQLSGENVFLDSPVPYFRITPADGSVKTGAYRDVPLHPAVIKAGFPAFAKGKIGPLFHNGSSDKAAETTANQVSEWVRSLKIIPAEIQPSHGWRHRMKSASRRVGMDARVVDAIQGHAGRTAGDHYGDVDLEAKIRNLRRMKAIEL
jgi:integrase